MWTDRNSDTSDDQDSLQDEDLELQLARLERETVKKSENYGRRNIRRAFVEEAAAVRKAEDDWSKLCKSIEEMELTSEEAPTEEVRKSEEFDRRNIRRVTRVRKGSLVSSSSLRRTDSSPETEDFVEEASAVEELAEAAAVRKAEEDWSMEGEKDGPLEEWTRKELKEECRNF